MGWALIIKNYYYLGFLNLLRKREERTLLLSRVKFLQHDSSSTSSVLRLPFCFYFSSSSSSSVCFLFHPSVPATLLLHTKRVLRLPLLCFLVQKQRKREDNNILCYSASASVFTSSISALSRVGISIVQLTSALLSPSSVTL